MTRLVPPGVALKEWAAVCHALLDGAQVALVRKGGVHEARRGFRPEHEAFCLYPNVEHESASQLKPPAQRRMAAYGPAPQEGGAVVLPGYCEVVDVVEVRKPERLRALEPHTCWTQAFFDVRLAYKPERPNYLLIVRAHRFATPLEIPYFPAYGGCRSWVPLRTDLPDAESAPALSAPALSDPAFEAHRRALLATQD